MPEQSDVLAYIPPSRISVYRLVILLVVVFIWTASLAIAWNWRRPSYSTLPLPRRAAWWTGMAAVSLSVGSNLFLFSLVNFDVAAFVDSLMASRGGKAWSVDGYVVTHPLLHLAPVAYTLAAAMGAYVAIAARGMPRLWGAASFLMAIPLVVSNGSRTLTMIVAGLSIVAALGHVRRPLVRYTWIAVVVAMSTTFVSLQVRTRDYGLAVVGDAPLASLAPVVHFDDTHSRLIQAMYLVDEHGIRWDAEHFFTQLILNFVPRYFWPERPVLDQAFFGEIKLDYVTISALGDLVASFGMTGGMLGFAVFCIVALGGLRWTYRIADRPFGIVAHLWVAFYVYSAMRSLHGLVAFFYISFGGLILALGLMRLVCAPPSVAVQPRRMPLGMADARARLALGVPQRVLPFRAGGALPSRLVSSGR